MGHVFALAAVNGDIRRINTAVLAAVELSFVKHPMRHLTRSEVKRRTEICAKWIGRLCEERGPNGRPLFGWSIDRALSVIRRALDAELSGEEFVPGQRVLWAPDAATLNPDPQLIAANPDHRIPIL